MLKYTGHPLVDVGVATITAFAGKSDPSKVTLADMDAVAAYIAREYVREPLRSLLPTAFTNNAWFFQDAYNTDKPGLSPEDISKRVAKRNEVIRAHLLQRSSNQPQLGDRDPFFNLPVIRDRLSDKLPVGRVGRAQLPLALRDEAINFYPNGTQGVPISGEALLCLQCFPLGSAYCSRGFLAVHSDNSRLMLHFAQRFLERHRKEATLVETNAGGLLQRTSRTLLIETLLEADLMKSDARDDKEFSSITAYHINNTKNARLNIYHLSSQIVDFLRDMHLASHRTQWRQVVKAAWEVEPETKKAKRQQESFQPTYNKLYEDLFNLPSGAKRFIRRYFLSNAIRQQTAADEELQNKFASVAWSVTQSFLRRIMNMEKQRIEEIRQFGDRLATYIYEQGDRVLLRNFRTGDFHTFRTLLLRTNMKDLKREREPLLQFDQFVRVFELAEEEQRPDWRLARDLVLIRIIEQLSKLRPLSELQDELPEVVDDEQS